MSGGDANVEVFVKLRTRTLEAEEAELRRPHSNSGASTSSETSSHRLYQTVADLWKDLPEALKYDPSVAPLGLGSAGVQSLAQLKGSETSKGCSIPMRPPSISSLALSRRSSKDYVALSMAAAGMNRPTVCKNCGTLPGLNEDDCDSVPVDEEKEITWVDNLRTAILFITWLVFTVILMTKSEKELESHQVSVPPRTTTTYPINAILSGNKLGVILSGSLLPPDDRSLIKPSSFLEIWLQTITRPNTDWNLNEMSQYVGDDLIIVQNVSTVWRVPVVENEFMEKVTREYIFSLLNYSVLPDEPTLHIVMRTNMKANLPLSVVYDISPIDTDSGVIYAAIVLLSLYGMIIFEVVHRTLAAMLASTASIGILALLDERPSMGELVTWIDVETLLLLFSMMVLVAIFSETGIFDYFAVVAFKMTGGKVWPLINTLCLLTVVLSTVLDNVTTVLLMTPVSIRLCEVTSLNPAPVLIAMMIYSNIGGAITPVGDPPNVMLASNPDVIKSGVNFAKFSMHMGIGTVIVFMVVHLHLRFIYRNVEDLKFREPQDVQDLRHEIAIWQRAAASLSSYSKDEDVVRETLVKKVRRLVFELKKKLSSGDSTPNEGPINLEAAKGREEHDSVRETLVKKVRRLVFELKKKLSSGTPAPKDYHETLETLIVRYPIRDKKLLVESSLALSFVVLFFFLHSIPGLKLSLGWTALLGVLLLLILSNHDIESLMARVEWSTLLFFAALFIMMEALSKLGLISWIGRRTQEVIMSVSQESRLTVTILLILWVSAAASAFVDNIPLTTMMVKIVTDLSRNQELNLPLQPLVWALAFGACFGGNGTLIGSSSNVVCAGVAEQHGYRFTFMQFFRVGFPVMLSSMVTITIYLLVAHISLEWNE